MFLPIQYLIAKGLWWIVHNDSLGQVPTQDTQVLDVVAIHTHAVLAKQSMPGTYKLLLLLSMPSKSTMK